MNKRQFQRLMLEIESRVTAAFDSVVEQTSFGFAFNCQMGRGRTTTGMIAATLVANVSFNYPIVLDWINIDKDKDSDTSRDSPDMTPFKERESDPFMAGEYKLILQLLPLPNVCRRM